MIKEETKNQFEKNYMTYVEFKTTLHTEAIELIRNAMSDCDCMEVDGELYFLMLQDTEEYITSITKDESGVIFVHTKHSTIVMERMDAESIIELALAII